jgi:Na+/proline symporter
MVIAFAIAMFIFGVIFYYIGVSMGWLYVSRTYSILCSIQTLYFQTFMGVLLGSAVVPIALCTTWSKANKWGCIAGAIAGLVAGIIAWMVTTAKLNPVINVRTTGGDYEMLAGNLAAIGVGGIISVVVSYWVSPSSIFSCYYHLFFIFICFCAAPRGLRLRYYPRHQYPRPPSR